MTVAEICVSAYLIVVGLAATLIWAALAASKRRPSQAKKYASYFYLKHSVFHEQNTRPSRSHS
jgi:hypothetical protein